MSCVVVCVVCCVLRMRVGVVVYPFQSEKLSPSFLQPGIQNTVHLSFVFKSENLSTT